MNYQSATGLRCFMFSLGAVYAADPDTARQIATDNGMTGPEARLTHEQLVRDSIATLRRLRPTS